MPPDSTTQPATPLERVLQLGIVAVIRSSRTEALADVAEALLAGGVDVLEITFTIPRPLRVLEQVADRIAGRALLGAGTILDAESARAAILAGAEFIVSPNTDPRVIEVCKRYGKLVIPGALTPTEIVTAWQAGADIVKVFPADVSGPKLLKAIHGPLPQVRLMPTGGVNLNTAADYLRAGACALGLGTSLVEATAVEQGDFQRIEDLSRQYIKIVQETRQELQE